MNPFSVLFAVVALFVVMLYCIAIINHIGPRCPRLVARAWVLLAITALWLAFALSVPAWHECQGWATAGFAGAVLLVFVAERRGQRCTWRPS